MELVAEFGHEASCQDDDGRAREEDAVEERLVLLERLHERMALVVDGERGNLERERDDVDGRVEQRGLELGLEINELGLPIQIEVEIRFRGSIRVYMFPFLPRWHSSLGLARQVDQ